MKKCKIPILIMVGASVLTAGLFSVADLYAQDQAPGVIRTPGEMQKPPNEGINSGWVVAYGVLLKRPYFVEFRDDTVWINIVQYLPRKKKSEPPKEVVQQTERDLQIKILKRLIEQTYDSLRSTRSQNEAKDILSQEFASHPMISEFIYSYDGGGTLWLQAKLKGGGQIFTSLEVQKWDDFGPPITDEQRMAVRRNEVNLVRSDLMKGHLMIFGYSGYESIDSGEKGSQLVGVVNSIKGGTMSLEEGRKQLKGILGYDKLVEEVMSHIESW
jgi:hypothetical protein